ncbi:CGNR zinc finger domain-containing protein [Amycolatopsis sp. H20-H5]|uniref:CGNR zinc finger domain-containing protein n=1 Tax=Amycolatopsis sp. H20-H5 TaxID=3046309 RepID=UPI002DBED01C|nr:CGNR zinc finger domain-containing protein [Amycolatopsis sp. H20-H5]MEC3976397.1 CGNR zinc finger domain-containing protein [Amycolatopsis sp. H20-H5]
MNFDSHTSDVVATTVLAVNLVTPGHALGREYRPAAADDELRELTRDSRQVAEVSADELDRFRDYAVHLRSVFAAVDAGRVDDACALTNALLRETRAAPVLARHDDEPWHLHFHATDAGWARSWAAAMATALAVVLGNPMQDRLGVCTAPACDRVLVDTSRNGTKRFCSTACQNRVKATAFRARRRD